MRPTRRDDYDVNGVRRFLGPLVVATMVLVSAVPAFAGSSFQVAAPNGPTVSLEGTPHLWIADEEGVLHWAGDSRALEGRFVNWSDRRVVNLAQLQSYRIGDPWLSAGLFKSGDPIYLVKWESGQERPTLLHIQSIRDLECAGISGANYGNFVLDQTVWEARFGMGSASLSRGTLQSICAPPPTAPSATATRVPLRAREVAVNKGSEVPVPTFENVIEVSGATPGERLTVRLEYEEYTCSANCTPASSTGRGRWGPIDAGPVDATGKLIYRDRHRPYKAYTYTFADTIGRTLSFDFGDDLRR